MMSVQKHLHIIACCLSARTKLNKNKIISLIKTKHICIYQAILSYNPKEILLRSGAFFLKYLY